MNKFFSSPHELLEKLACVKQQPPSTPPKITPSSFDDLLRQGKRDWSASQPGEVIKKEELETEVIELKKVEPQKKPTTILPIVSPYDKVKPKKRQEKPKFSSLEKARKVDKVIALSKPEYLDAKNPYINKMFKINITFQDLEGKKHSKTIFFGSKKKAYYVTHKNEYLKQASLHRMRGESNILEPRFYELELLDGASTDLEENFLALVKKLVI